MQFGEDTATPHESRGSEVTAFMRRTSDLRLDKRFRWQDDWRPVDAKEVAETLACYFDSLLQCLEQLREGKVLRSGLAYFRVRR